MGHPPPGSNWSGCVSGSRPRGAAGPAGTRADPAAADSRLLLYAVPVNGCPPRRVPGPGEPVMCLCDGTISTAQRLRHTARTLPAQAWWSPAMTAALGGSIDMIARIGDRSWKVA